MQGSMGDKYAGFPKLMPEHKIKPSWSNFYLESQCGELVIWGRGRCVFCGIPY